MLLLTAWLFYMLNPVLMWNKLISYRIVYKKLGVIIWRSKSVKQSLTSWTPYVYMNHHMQPTAKTANSHIYTYRQAYSGLLLCSRWSTYCTYHQIRVKSAKIEIKGKIMIIFSCNREIVAMLNMLYREIHGINPQLSLLTFLS